MNRIILITTILSGVLAFTLPYMHIQMECFQAYHSHELEKVGKHGKRNIYLNTVFTDSSMRRILRKERTDQKQMVSYLFAVGDG